MTRPRRFGIAGAVALVAIVLFLADLRGSPGWLTWLGAGLVVADLTLFLSIPRPLSRRLWLVPIAAWVVLAFTSRDFAAFAFFLGMLLVWRLAFVYLAPPEPRSRTDASSDGTAA
jgi:hypothetical protein